MKILKIFGIVVGIHLFAFILIFANPGCSSTTQPAPQPADTVASAAAPTITVPAAMSPADPVDPMATTVTPATGGFNPDAPARPAFNPDAPATYAGSASGAVRFTPTRPNTPAANAVLTQPVENVTPATTYVVKPGDNLWLLGKRFHISYKDIAAANGLKVSAPLHDGQKLIIPTKPTGGAAAASSAAKARTAAAAPAAPAHAEAGTARPTNEQFKYTVKSGETLGMIARHFDVRTRDLAVENNISDPRNLRAGSVLVIPGWKATTGGGHAAKSAPAPAAPKETPAPSTEPNAVPNLLEPAPAEPTQTPTTSIPVINLDDTPVTPAPKS